MYIIKYKDGFFIGRLPPLNYQPPKCYVDSIYINKYFQTINLPAIDESNLVAELQFNDEGELEGYEVENAGECPKSWIEDFTDFIVYFNGQYCLGVKHSLANPAGKIKTWHIRLDDSRFVTVAESEITHIFKIDNETGIVSLFTIA